jgi:hypothetical protein
MPNESKGVVGQWSGRLSLNNSLLNPAVSSCRLTHLFASLWRALTDPYQDQPLAVLDNRSLSQNDLIPADIVFPHYCDEGYEVRYSPLHRWFYKQRMTPDDALMFKLYDSSSDVSRCRLSKSPVIS